MAEELRCPLCAALLFSHFMFQGQATQAHSSEDDNHLQFGEGDFILVISDTQAEVTHLGTCLAWQFEIHLAKETLT